MKRFLILIMVLAMIFGTVFSFASCKSDTSSPDDDNGIVDEGGNDTDDEGQDDKETDEKGENEPDGGEENPPEGGDDNPPEGGDDNPPEGGDDNPPEGGDDNPPEGGDDNPPEGGDDNPPEGGDDNPPESGDDNPPESGDDNPPESGDDNPPEGGDDNPPESGDDNPPEGGDDNPPEGGNDNPPEGGDDNPPEGGDDNPPEGSDDNPPEGGEDNPPEGGNDDPVDEPCTTHTDVDQNDYCDTCDKYLIVVIDFYVINDLHGKFCDTNGQPGVDEIGTYLESIDDDHQILISSGDMWQGTAESVLTNGEIMVDWMNALGFVCMTMGNHEFDWGEEAIRDNLEISDFPFLAINIYDNTTGKLADYCTPSIMVEKDGVQIGIIGAIGDCYSSIFSDLVKNVSFKTGSALTTLVKAEADRLRAEGADFIVYSIHDDTSGYDTALSNGYVDLVFEAHTHSEYVTTDSYGIYHLQAGGENDGLSHVEISINILSGNSIVNKAENVLNSKYSGLEDHEETEAIEDKYADVIEYASRELGVVSRLYGDSEIEDFVAQLYLEAGLEKWKNYNIVLGGGYLKTRDPYDLSSGIKKYGDLVSLFPFNNRLVLCSVSGSKLKSQFINTTNSNYHIAKSDYYSSITIQNSGTYYIVVDDYTAAYAPNGLTIVEYYDESTYARDLLADAIEAGRLEDTGASTPTYEFTTVTEAITIGNGLAVGGKTKDHYYVKGIVNSNPNSYGSFYLKDDSGNTIYVYSPKDGNGNNYSGMTDKYVKGDEIILYSRICKYMYESSGDIVIELYYPQIIEVN